MTEVDEISFRHIDQLNEKAWLYRTSDTTRLLNLTTQALERSRHLHYEKGEADALSTRGFYHIRTAEHEQALEFLNQALSIFQRINNFPGLARVYQSLGVIKRRKGDYENSMAYLFNALRIQQQEGLVEEESLTLYNISVTYRYLSNIDQTLEYLLQALELARKVQYKPTEASALYQLGSIYTDMGDFFSALDHYHQSLKLRRELDDKWGEADCLNHLGLIYNQINEFAKAEKNCLDSLMITQDLGDKKGTGDTLYHLGMIYHKMGKKEYAAQYVSQSLHIRSEIEDKRGQVESLLLFIEVFLHQDHQATERLLNEANNIGQDIQAKDLLLHIHREQYKFYKNLAHFEKALFHLEKQLQFEKELYNQTINQKLNTQKINYQIEQAKKEAENIALKAEMKVLTDRQRIARDLHDDVGSTLSSISILSESYLREGKTEIDSIRLGNLSNKAREALESMSDIVWMINPENDSIEQVLTRMTAYAVEILESIGIELVIEIEEVIWEVNFPLELRKDFYLLFKEAINNAAKYSAATQVRIKLNKLDQEIYLEIKDDGNGFDVDNKRHGNGLKNMLSRAERMQGQLQIKSAIGQGTLINLTLPLI